MPTRFDIDRFLNIRSATGPSFSPDGRFVTFLTNITGVAQLWQVPVDGGWPTQLTFTKESVREAHYSPRKHELIYSMDAGGNERTQLYRLHGVVGGTDHAIGDGWISDDLTKEPKAIHMFGGWSHDGERFAFNANRDKPDRFDIYIQKVGARWPSSCEKALAASTWPWAGRRMTKRCWLAATNPISTRTYTSSMWGTARNAA